MTELLTAAQMRAIEAAAIASGEVTGLELMERAGAGVVAAVLEEWPELAEGAQRAVVLCGPGNNGGDGFVVARLLRERGWAVEVFLYGAPERMPPDARVNYERWLGMGEVGAFSTNVDALDAQLIVDALFGTGFTRGLDEELAQNLAHLAQRLHGEQFVCAVDCPSGLCLDSGRLLSVSNAAPQTLRADLTVTFSSLKIGHLLQSGPEMCGKVVVTDIGIGWWQVGRRAIAKLYEVWPPGRNLNGHVVFERGPDPRAWKKGELLPLAHKYAHGHALILSGPSGRGGAARLSARGALRIGAGVVTLGCPPEALPENAARLDAVMLRPLADAAALSNALEDRRINALCLGPALGVGAREADLVATALGVAGGAVRAERTPYAVLDADALTILAQHPDLFAALHKGCVLTPHAGEFARLFPDIAEKLAAPATKGPAYSKVDAAREAAQRAGCVVLFKGPDTVIAAPDGRCAINSAQYDRAAPWLATAGSGDVLAGFITGLLARGFGPFDAACTGAWLHVECARDFGPGLIAEDLPERLPAVFRGLGL
jgi:hydroxyethylthiazole kinase-like uncharacterized protein yjeF